MKVVWGLLALVVAILAGITLDPDRLGLADATLSFPFAQVISMRGVIMVALLIAAIFFAIIGAIRHRMLDRGRIAGALALVLLLVGIGHGAIIYDRGVANPSQLGPDRGLTQSQTGDGSITVLTYNTLGGATTPTQLVDVIVSDGVDVVVLPETSTADGEQLVALLAEQSMSFQQFDNGTSQYNPDFESTVLLISSSLGEYVQTSASNDSRSSVSAAPANGSGPQIIGAHPIAPVPALHDQWRTDIAGTYDLCQTDGSFILAGDFNSTVDHQLALGADCTDGGEEAGSAGLGSWPSGLPSLLGSPIDRVLHDGGTYRGTDARLVDVGGSDHRGLVVRLTPQS